MAADEKTLREWDSLTAEEKTRVQVEYGYYLDSLPPSCSLETKIERFRQWLKTEKGIDYK